MKDLNIVFYGLFGLLLASAGIGITDWKLYAAILLMAAVDANSFAQGTKI